jgi:hypothetical protein
MLSDTNCGISFFFVFVAPSCSRLSILHRIALTIPRLSLSNNTSVGDNYDYTNQYGRQMRDPVSVENSSAQRDRMTSADFTQMSGSNSASVSKLGRVGENLFADDASFEQQFAEPEERFDVIAPAGKLGMVIDTPAGCSPIVHAIKETSVLAHKVRVGDRLLSVDDEDCTGMTAMQVSKLISLKSEKPARVLTFARSATNASPSNDEDDG